MHLLFAGFSDDFFQPLCWTLIHSLWQGLVAAIMAALIVTLTKKSSAAVRYNLLIAILGLFVIAMIITAYRQFQLQKPATGISTVTINEIQVSSTGLDKSEVAVPGNANNQNLTRQFTVYFNEHAAIIVMIWFLFFLVKCSQLLAGLQYIHRIRHRNNYEVSIHWKQKLVQLANKTGIRGSIMFLESELVKVPAVIGFLKPVLLVPAGLISSLPAEQVEAILLHELAHIRRKDFFVNLLQSFIETFFFFNPAVVWISSLIREEREACCDDIVIENMPQKGSYLQALVSFHELQLKPGTHAMALTGKKNYLFNRVTRMLTQENKKLNLMEKTALLLSIIGITAFSFITKEINENPKASPAKEIIQPVTKKMQATTEISAKKKPVSTEKKSRAISFPKSIADTLPKTNVKRSFDSERKFPSISSTINNDGNSVVSVVEATDNTGKQYRIKRVDGKITELIADGKEVPQSQYSEYDEVIRQIDETQRQNTVKRKEKMELMKAEGISKRKELFEKKMAMSKESNKERLEKMDSFRINNYKKLQSLKLIEQKNQLMKKDYTIKNTELLQKHKLLKPEKTNIDVSRIISDMNNQKLVSDPENLSFSLNNKELIINGTKQPAEIHQQFKEKYIQSNTDLYNYSKHGNTTSITISRN